MITTALALPAGFDIHGRGLIGDHHILLLHLDGHRHIHALYLAGRQRNGRRLKWRESLVRDLDNVAARRQSMHLVGAARVRIHARCGGPG